MEGTAFVEDEATKVFVALADPTRRLVLQCVADGDLATATTVASELTITRQGVLKHLTVLAEAGLVQSVRHGREVRFHAQPEPLRHTASWLSARADSWDQQLMTLKAEAERRAAGRPRDRQ